MRATILPLLDSRAAWHISQQVTKLLLPAVPEGGVWLQDAQLLHATVFHASSHMVRALRGRPAGRHPVSMRLSWLRP